MNILQSTIERLAWLLVLVVFITELFVGYYAWRDGRYIKDGVQQINKQLTCISEFFNQSGTIRSQSSIQALGICNRKGIQQ